MIFRMMGMYSTLAAMNAEELHELSEQLKFNPDPWAVGARKLVATEILSEKRARNQIFIF